MKIAIPVFVLQGGKSGVSTYTLELLRHLPRIHEYHVFIPRNERYFVEGRHIHEVASSIENPAVNFLWTNFVFPWQAKKFDCVHYPCFRKLPLHFEVPHIATCHDIGPYLIPEKYGYVRHLYHRYILPRRLHACAHIIAVSHATKQDLMEYLHIPEEKISVIYSGVDRKRFYPVSKGDLEERRPYFVYVSRIEHPSKNHVRLIEAFEFFRNRSPGAEHELIFAGADWNGADIVKKRAALSPYSKDIHFFGFVSGKTIRELYSGADAMVFPSLFEGFGLPILEALACVTKVITANTSSMKELAALANLTTFDPYNPQSIAEAMMAVLREPKKSYDQFLSQFSWDKTAHEVAEIYARYGKR